MATEKFKQLQDMSDADLMTELEGTVTQYRRLKFDHVIKGLENPIGLRDIRHDIARLKTEVRRRELHLLSDQETARRTKLRERRRSK